MKTHIQTEQARYRSGGLCRPPNKRRPRHVRDREQQLRAFMRRERKRIKRMTGDNLGERVRAAKRALYAFVEYTLRPRIIFRPSTSARVVTTLSGQQIDSGESVSFDRSELSVTRE